MLDSLDEAPSGIRAPLLLISPAAGGKTAACLQHVIETHAANPLARIWVVVATGEQRVSFRRRLLNETGIQRQVNFGVELMLFSELYARIVDSIDIPPRRVSYQARRYLLRKALRNATTNGPLEHYGSIAHTHGFEEAALQLIDELQGNGVSSGIFTNTAGSPKERDLGRIYAAYENILRSKELCDDSNLGRLAVEALDKYPTLATRIDLLVVDGFDRLNRTQLATLERLSARARQTIFTITYSEARSLDVHRRFAATFEELCHLGCKAQAIETPPDPARAAPLAHLEASLFAIGEGKQIPADGTVALLEAPDPVREVQAVGRRVKRLLLDGVPTESIIVMARNLSVYGPLCHEVFQSFGIPVAVNGGRSLAANPAVTAFLGLVVLADDKFPRARLVELLRNPYISYPKLAIEQITLLDRVSRERVVIQGREQWLQSLTRIKRVDGPASAPREGIDEELDIPKSVLDDLSAEQIDALRDALTSFLDLLTPPVKATTREYVRWIEGLIGPDPEEQKLRIAADEPGLDEGESFNIVAQARNGPASSITRDVEALCELKSILAGILAGVELAEPGGTYSWTEFRQDLLKAIERATYDPEPSKAGRVVVAEARSQRGVPRDHVFLLGMAEGNFPQRAPEDPLLSRFDRKSLIARGIELDAMAESDDMSLFYEVTSLPRRSLTLSQPYLDDTGNPWPASPYVRAVTQLFNDLTPWRMPLSYLPPPTEAASLSELSIRISDEGSPDESAAAAWLARKPETAAAWANTLRTRRIARSRERKWEPGAYNGVFADPALLTAIGKWLGERHVWSVTQFNEYGECPFKFFATRLLKLELVEEPQEGFDQLHLGVINHRILEVTYRRMMEDRIALCQEELPKIEKIFDEVANDELELAPARLGFRPTAWWRQERSDIRQRLWRLIQDDVAEGLGVQLYKQEVRFDRGSDCAPLLELRGPAGVVRVRGQIDRIDRVGNGYRVIDYKSGSSKIAVEDQAAGRNTQMQVYLLAAEELLRHWGEPDGPIEGFFRHIRSREKSGQIALGDQRVKDTCQIIHRHVLESRQGQFPVQPSKVEGGKCHGHCDFGNLCGI